MTNTRSGIGTNTDAPTPAPAPLLPRDGGHVVVDALSRAGVRSVFAIHGVQIEPVFQACVDLDVALVDVRHEASAGFAAEAAARLSGGIGVAAVCPGPGFTNILTSIANARTDRTPLVVLVGATPDAAAHSNGLQVGLEHAAVAAPFAKWTCRVPTAAHLPRLVAQAIRVAATAPCGPVVLEVPADVLAAPAHDGTAPPAPVAAAAAAVDGGVAARFADRLARAQRPALLLGHTASAAARTAVRVLAERTGIVCFAGYGAIGALADDDPAYGGTAYQLGRLPAGARPDVLLAVGTAFGFDTPGLRGGSDWDTEVLHVDADPAELGRFGHGGEVAVGDPDAFLLVCADAAGAAGAGARVWPDRGEWRARVRAERAALRAGLDAIAEEADGRAHPYAVGRAVSDAAAASGAVLVGDGAVCKHWLHDALRLPLGAHYLTHGRLGCMGMGAGLSIGASYHRHPDGSQRPVLCATGDGAVGFALGDFEAMVRHRLPIVTVVCNNACWGASIGFQQRPGGRGRSVGTTLSDADYHAAMIGFGGNGCRVDTVASLRAALTDALRHAVEERLPSCITVSTSTLGLAPEIPQLNA